MIRKYGTNIFLGLLCLQLVAPLGAQETNATAVATNSTDEFLFTPTREQGRIAFLTARLLEGLHYSHHLLNSTYASEFLDQYLEALDPQHLHFLQSDLAEFEKYRTNLDFLTVEQARVADVSPAFVIFSRFMERLEQRVNYADDLLKNEKFKFNGDDRIVIDRRDLPYPQNLDDAKRLWRERLRYEFLREKISRIESDKKKTNDLAAQVIHLQPGISKYDGHSVISTAHTLLENPDLDRGSPGTKAEVSLTNALPAKPMEQEIAETLTRRYNRNLKLFKDWDSDDVLEIYLTSLAHVYDPHSDYMGKSALQSFAIQMNLALFGIGAELTSSEDGFCTIRRLMPGGPAIKSGKLADGDRIVAVGQSNQPPVDVVDWSLSKVVQLIRGAKGTEVRLTISPANSAERKVVSLIRDEIPLEDQAAKAKLIEFTGDNSRKTRIGVIDLPSFYAPVDLGGGSKAEAHYTSVDVAQLLNKLKEEKVDGVILDLRRNGGGSLEEAIRLTGLFIKDGPVVQVRASDGSVQVDEDNDPSVTYDGPLIVLTSRFSASASEIVAGALQDYGRALIVGDVSTHGKGTVQNVNPLQQFMGWRESTNDPGAVKVTIRKFYRASGASTQFKGVMPDIVLPSALNYLDNIGERSLDHPLKWDTIESAKYQPENRVEPYLPDLLMRSATRVATNQDFVYVREDIEQVRRKQADKTASLNEKEVLKEMDEEQARNDARDKERAARKKPNATIYEITLKQAALPGLPLPVGATNSVATAENDSTDDETPTVSTEPPKAPSVDVDLDESERIMMDYLSLLSKQNIAAVKNN